ncbi:MAG: ABC transporter ATP-binding protein [Planctomycetota bacterium]
MSAREKDHHDEELAVGGVYDKRLLGRILEYAYPHRWALAGAVGLLLVFMLLRLAGPKIIQLIVDGPVDEAARARASGEPLPPGLAEQVTAHGMLYLTVGVAMAGTLLLREWLMNRTGQRIVFELRNKLFGHLLRLPVAWHDRHAVGWTVTRTTSDVDALAELFTTGVATLVYDILFIIVATVMLVIIAPKLAVVALLLLPLMMIVSFRFRLKARVAYRATRASLSRLNAFLQERLTGLAVVHLFRREASSARRFDTLNTRYYTDNMLTVRHFSLFFPTVDTLAWTVRLGCLVYGAWLIVHGELAVGIFLQFWLYLQFVFEPIRELAEKYNILQSAMAAAERVIGILDARAEDAPALAVVTGPARPTSLPSAAEAAIGPAPGQAPAVAPAGTDAALPATPAVPAIEFRHVSFAYPTGGDVLHDVSFSVGRGERVAVVGHTGAGKSTLVNLLCRFHETPRGSVLVDGTDVEGIAHSDLRRRIAIVQQDVFLFSDSISANIRMGDETMTAEQVEAASRAVHAHAFVSNMPEGYDSVLLERGSNLSSGQRQLIAFARALAADPEILVLDEATSSVDSETEALVESATVRLMEGRTSLVIAHRLSTVVSADRILVMHKGRLHEQGTHTELMAQRGLYWKLYRLHLAGSAGTQGRSSVSR